MSVTEENIKKLSANTTIAATANEKTINATSLYWEKVLTVPVYLAATTYYCQPASAQMLTKYYRNTKPSQDSIYNMMGGVAPTGVDNPHALLYYRSTSGLNKPGSYEDTNVYFTGAIVEIDNGRPFMSGLPDHARVCCGYKPR